MGVPCVQRCARHCACARRRPVGLVCEAVSSFLEQLLVVELLLHVEELVCLLEDQQVLLEVGVQVAGAGAPSAASTRAHSSKHGGGP